MRIIWATTPEDQDALERWAAEKIPHIGPEGKFSRPAVFGAVVGGGEVVSVMIFHDWQPEYKTLQVSTVSTKTRWAHPEVISEFLRYAFVTVGANKLWTATPHTNERALRFNLGIGFKKEGTLRHHFGVKCHAVICSMLVTEYERSRWIKGNS